MSSLPFRIDTSYSEFAETEGVARLTADGLMLEFQVKDAFFGLIKSAPREALIPLTEIAEATFKSGVFRVVITIRGRRLSTLASVPGAAQGELRLKCRRKYRELAQELVSRLAMKVLENEVRELTQNQGSVVGQPPLPPPGA